MGADYKVQSIYDSEIQDVTSSSKRYCPTSGRATIPV